MKWFLDFRQDVRRCVALDGGPAWKQVLLEQGLWALLEYRMEFAVHHSTLPRILKRPLRLLFLPWRKLVEIATGISLPCTARIGPGLHLPHCGMRIVNANAIVGANCCISQGVTIGVSGRGKNRGVPVIGDRVYFGANAVVAGKISVGDDVVIGANSLVNRDVPSHRTVVGVPATVVSAQGSEDYLGNDGASEREMDQIRKAPVNAPRSSRLANFENA